MIGQAKFTYSPHGKTFEKQIKTIEEQGKKQIDAIADQNEGLAALTNKNDDKDDDKYIHKEKFDKLVKERFDGIKELTYEIDHDDLTYYFKGDTTKKDLMISIMV